LLLLLLFYVIFILCLFRLYFFPHVLAQHCERRADRH
jgi:hypothetical protein